MSSSSGTESCTDHIPALEPLRLRAGDIAPVSAVEELMAAAIMLFGVVLFGFVIAGSA